MSRRRGFLLCAIQALSTALLASDGETPAALPGTSAAGAAGEAGEAGVPALFTWTDVDGDGRLELAAVHVEGAFQLLRDGGDGRFEDVTEEQGLSGIENAALGLWADYDADGRLDLFVGAREGASRLFHNDGGVFVDVGLASGLSSEGPVLSAHWLDHDGDGRLDLHLVTAAANELYRGLEGGFFTAVELPALATSLTPVFPAGERETPEPEDAPIPPGASGRGESRRVAEDRPRGAAQPAVQGPTISSASLPPLTVFGCAQSIKDQANPGSCLQVSTTPTLGMLHPLSTNLFVAVSGDVGIGTTSPAARLEVAGTARITNTLTLAPSGDQALDVSTGSIYKGGALFVHTKGGEANTGVGREALARVTNGTRNTANGYRALSSNTSGSFNTANGNQALYSNTTGLADTASGWLALYSNTTGSSNTASGGLALFSNTTGSLNTASGYRALRNNTTGSSNTACGYQALTSNTTGFANAACGYGALSSNTIGTSNTASGDHALRFNTTGSDNTASGSRTLYLNTTGFRNIALGKNAGSNLTTGSYNIAIGNDGVAGESNTIRIGAGQTQVFIAGIYAKTTGLANAIPVLVDSAGQLGTVSSSRRFKKEIRDMGDLTERLLELRPVVFRYKQEQRLPDGSEVPLEYGLIAEEVAEVFPDLVVYDEQGQPFTVKYHLLASMLLNEFKQQDEELKQQGAAHASEKGQLREELEELRSRLAAVESRTSSGTVAALIPSGGH